MLFWCDRIIFGDRINGEITHIQLKAAGCTLIFSYFPLNSEGWFLCKLIAIRKNALGHAVLRNDALNEASAVPQQQKPDFAAGALVIKPPVKGDFFSDVRGQIFNVSTFHDALLSNSLRKRPKKYTKLIALLQDKTTLARFEKPIWSADVFASVTSYARHYCRALSSRKLPVRCSAISTPEIRIIKQRCCFLW